MIRPQPARWFDVIVARDDAFLALEALASTGCVQIEWHGAPTPAPDVPGRAGELLKESAAAARRYRDWWPHARLRLPVTQVAPIDLLAEALARVKRWAAVAEPTIRALQLAQSRAGELELACQAMREFADSAIDFSQLAAANHGVVAGLFAVPGDRAPEVPADCLVRVAEVGAERLLLAVGAPESIDALARSVAEFNGRRASFPDGLAPTPEANLALLQVPLEEAAAEVEAQRAVLAQLAGEHDLAHTLGDIARAAWCFDHGGAISGDIGRGRAGDDDAAILAHIAGWATDRETLVRAIEASNARALVSFPAPPRGAHPPLTLRNPWWVRPFEVFARLVGLPGAGGTDPSTLLALIVPVMFGYMFGDVGHGLLLAAVGLALRNRLPVLRVLVPCGLVSAAFGLVFGSVFALKHLIEPLWLPPLEHPLPILVVPLVAGATMLALGLLIGLLEAWWQRRIAQWLREDAPLLFAYIGVLGGFLIPALWALVAAAGLWAMLGAVPVRRAGVRRGARPWSRFLLKRTGRTLAAAFTALGHWFERLVQILINTLSFARVGAFALAHAGLSSAVGALADAAGGRVGFAVVFVIGNLLIVALEGLVVSIQTTRLVLFEFFTRFYRPEGREFRPLAPPPVTLES